MEVQVPTVYSLLVESSIWFGVVTLVVICRFTSQVILRHSITRFQCDDWLMVFACCTYILVLFGTNYDEHYNSLSSEQITPDSFKRTGIIIVLAEHAMITTLWSVKGTFLIVYHRLTLLRRLNTVVKAVAIYCALGYIAVVATLYGGFCRPFSEYLELVPDNYECVSWFKYNILQFTFNVTSDIMILGIPIALVSTSQMRLQKKILLSAVFAVGLFVVVCSAFTKYYIFAFPSVEFWIPWYVREASTAVIVGNLYLIMPLLRKVNEVVVLRCRCLGISRQKRLVAAFDSRESTNEYRNSTISVRQVEV